MSEQKQPIGFLFDSIAYYQTEDITNLIENMTFEQSIYVINQALEYAYNNGAFTLKESEAISKSLRTLSNQILTK
jgi:hypothetical protein